MSTIPASQVPLWAPLYGANPVDAVRRYFLKYAQFTGRASRSEYWWIALLNFLVYSVAYVVALLGFLTGSSDGSGGPGPIWPLGAFAVAVLVIWTLGTIVPNIALAVRRFHDAGFSGPLVLLGLIPYVGGLIVQIFALLPPSAAGRRFDAPGGVPQWQNGQYGTFPPAPGEPDLTPAAWATPPDSAAPFSSPYGQPGTAPYGQPAPYGTPYGAAPYGTPYGTPPLAPLDVPPAAVDPTPVQPPVAPPHAVTPPPHDGHGAHAAPPPPPADPPSWTSPPA